MSRRIWKYELDHGAQRVAMPRGAQVLYAAAQHESAVLYMLVEPSDESEIKRTVVVAATGDQVEDGAQPAGLIVLYGGTLMFHVFVWPEPPEPAP